MSLKFKRHLRSFRVTHYVILNVILYAFYEFDTEKRQLATLQFVKRIQNYVQDDLMRDAKMISSVT